MRSAWLCRRRTEEVHFSRNNSDCVSHMRATASLALSLSLSQVLWNSHANSFDCVYSWSMQYSIFNRHSRKTEKYCTPDYTLHSSRPFPILRFIAIDCGYRNCVWCELLWPLFMQHRKVHFLLKCNLEWEASKKWSSFCIFFVFMVAGLFFFSVFFSHSNG